MAKRKQRKSTVPWGEIRKAYVTGGKGVTLASVAGDFGLHVTTVKTRAAKEEWTKDRRAPRVTNATNTTNTTSSPEVVPKNAHAHAREGQTTAPQAPAASKAANGKAAENAKRRLERLHKVFMRMTDKALEETVGKDASGWMTAAGIAFDKLHQERASESGAEVRSDFMQGFQSRQQWVNAQYPDEHKPYPAAAPQEATPADD